MPIEGQAEPTAPIIESSTPSDGTTPPETAPTASAQDPHVAQKFAALAKREKAIVQRKQELSTLEQQFKQREADLKQWEDLVLQAKADPRPFLEKLGWDYNKLTEAKLNDFKPKPEDQIKSLADQIAEMKQEQVKKAEADKQARIQAEKDALASQEKQARDQVRSEIASLGEEYEFINLFGEHDLVYDTMLEHFKKTGRVMSVEDAAKQVEDYLEKEEVEKITKAKKFQSKYSPQSKQDAGRGADGHSPAITNRTASSPQGVVPPKTEAERMARALAALEKRG